MTSEVEYYDLLQWIDEVEYYIYNKPDDRHIIILRRETYEGLKKLLCEAREETARFEMENTGINFVGRRLAIVDKPHGFSVARTAVIKQLFHDKHFLVEFDDDHSEREIYVDQIQIGADVVK